MRGPILKRARGEGWVVAQFLLLATLALLPRAGPALPLALRRLVPPLVLAGAALLALGAVALGASLTILPHPRPEGRLVRGGIYRIIRHPIYGGVILLAFAWAFWRASLPHVVLAAAVAVFFATKARYEERWLLARFPEYAAYRRRVRAFIPGIY